MGTGDLALEAAMLGGAATGGRPSIVGVGPAGHVGVSLRAFEMRRSNELLTLGYKSFRDLLAALRVAEEADGDTDALAGEDAIVVLVGEVPDLREDCGGELGAAEYLDGGLACDDAELLSIRLGKYVVDEGDFLGRGGELGHGQ